LAKAEEDKETLTKFQKAYRNGGSFFKGFVNVAAFAFAAITLPLTGSGVSDVLGAILGTIQASTDAKDDTKGFWNWLKKLKGKAPSNNPNEALEKIEAHLKGIDFKTMHIAMDETTKDCLKSIHGIYDLYSLNTYKGENYIMHCTECKQFVPNGPRYADQCSYPKCDNKGEGWKKGKTWSSPTTLASYGINLEANWTLTQVKGTIQKMLTKVFNRLYSLKDENATLKTQLDKLQSAVISTRPELAETLTNGEVEKQTNDEAAAGAYAAAAAAAVVSDNSTGTTSLWTAEDIAEVRTLLEDWGIQEPAKKAELLLQNPDWSIGWDDTSPYLQDLVFSPNILSALKFTADEIPKFRQGFEKYIAAKSMNNIHIMALDNSR